MNAGIQGLAADIFKVALVRLDGARGGGRSRLILQVHDEVILEVPTEHDEVGELTLRRCGAPPSCGCRSRSTLPSDEPGRRRKAHRGRCASLASGRWWIR